MAVRLKDEALRGQGTDRWYVTDGQNAVGPVRRDLLVRGLEAGRVPLDSFVRHEGWKIWRPLTDFAIAEASVGGVAGPPEPSGPLSSLLDEDDDPAATVQGDGLDADDEEELAWGDSVETHAGHVLRPSAMPDTATPSTLGSSAEVPTQVSRDLLGGDRPTLASYLDDDEETNVPGKKPSIPPGTAPSVPPPHVAPPHVAPSVPPQGSVDPSRRSSDARRPQSVPPPAPPPPNISEVVPQAGQQRVSVRAPSVRPTGPPPPGQFRSLESNHPRPPSIAPPRGTSPSGSRSVRPAASNPEDDLVGATDLSEALLLLLNSMVRRTGAEVALLHRMADDGATVMCAHGANMIDLLGTRTRLLDAAVVAAAGGNIVIAEPAPGPAGEATINRLRKSGIDPEGALMFPIRPRARLLGFVELGSPDRFELRAIVRAEETMLAFVGLAEAGSWPS